MRYLSDYCLFAAEMAAFFFALKPKKTWRNPRSLCSSLALTRNRCASGFKPNHLWRCSQQKILLAILRSRPVCLHTFPGHKLVSALSRQ